MPSEAPVVVDPGGESEEMIKSPDDKVEVPAGVDVSRKIMISSWNAVMSAIATPERSVKWHGSLVARLLLEDNNLPLNDYVSDWSMGPLSAISEACKAEHMPMAQVALSAFLLSLERSHRAKKLVMEKGLPTMREAATCTAKHKVVQESLAKALELMCTDDIHLPLEDSEKWSTILIPWACGKVSSEKTSIRYEDPLLHS
ncbi:hypothetical protein Drorol1_Dr00011728 [Drosera rotundifolia]